MPVLSMEPVSSPLDWCRGQFHGRVRAERHIFLPQTLGSISVVQEDRDFRRQEHPVARTVIAE